MLIIRISLVLALFIHISNASSDSLKTLIMPGKVIQSHAKYEEQCEQCHDTSDKSKQGTLCVKCHAHNDIAKDLRELSGFHGRIQKQQRNNCKHCHTEHKGRKKYIILLNRSTFDHQKTDFTLRGLHRNLSCQSCHKANKKYSEAPSRCYSCHKNSDTHKGKQGKKCQTCHSEQNWQQTQFKHNKTDFALRNAHKKVRCSVCHINNQYKDTPKQCINCHKINDIHNGKLGKKCNSCHNTKKWNKIRFNHNKKTKFPLHGKHKKTSCTRCHTSADMKKDLPKSCHACHKNDDKHKQRYGKKCASCHSPLSWTKTKFNHYKKTHFLLSGKHRKLPCNQCHKGRLYEDKLKDNCYSCHRKNDIHKGKQGETCNNCHNEKGWKNNVSFDHDLSNFPLIGMHATTQCEECHLSTVYADTQSGCNACHADNDVHKTRLGTDCETCHNPNSWFTWIFDHNKNTKFKIDGKHKKTGCYDCHQTQSTGKLKASRDCISCHRNRDIHNQSFGRQCGECHNTKDFRDISIKR